MRPEIVFAAGMAVLGASACGGGRAAEIRTSEYPAGERWTASLATPAAMVGATQMSGTAWMAQGNDPAQTHVEISIENAVPGGRHPWHVHRGTCGNDQGILGPPERYGVLEVGGDGTASRAVTLPVALPSTGSYMVNVHASEANLRTIVSCGNLAPPVR